MNKLKLIEHYVLALASVAILLLGSILLANAQQIIKQETHGVQSPAIKAGGNVTVIYKSLPKAERELIFRQMGNNQQLIDRLLMELEAQNAELENSRVEIKEWVKKYEELKFKISELSEATEQSKKAKAEAKAALIGGDLKKAESATLRGGSISGGSIR